MKSAILFLVLFSCPIVCTAQTARPDLKTLLQDSSYLFNRYDEMTSGMNVEIDNSNVSDILKNQQQKLTLSSSAKSKHGEAKA